jgi:hypothetical protein
VVNVWENEKEWEESFVSPDLENDERPPAIIISKLAWGLPGKQIQEVKAFVTRSAEHSIMFSTEDGLCELFI